MKCVIFCLLAFSIFETVFADQFDQDMMNLSDKFENQMLAIQDTFSEAIDTEADAAGILTGGYKYGHGCSGSSDKAMDRYYELRMKRCNQCIDNAYTDKNVQSAEDCCEKAVLALRTDEKFIHAMAKECIAKCTQPEVDCNKEIQNLETIATEVSKKNLDSDKIKETQNV